VAGDQRQAVGELLWNLGYRDVENPQEFIAEALKKTEKYDIEHELAQNMEDIADGLREGKHELLNKIEAIRNYIVNLRSVPEKTMMTCSTVVDIIEKILGAEG